MASPTSLLTLPLEIRDEIYSYMLLNEDVKDVIAANVTRPQEHGLFLTCRQLYFEALKYYYNANTFQLSLCDPTYSPDVYLHGDSTLMKRLGGMRNLHVEIGFMECKRVGDTSGDVFVLRYENELRWRRFVKQLIDVHEGQAGWLLRSLVVVDRSAPPVQRPSAYHLPNQVSESPPIDPSVSENKAIALKRLVEPLDGNVGKVTIEIRSGYVWTPLVPIDNYYPYTVLMSSAVSPK